MVVEAVVNRLSRADATELLVDRERDDLDQLRAEADALRAQIAAAEDEYDEGVIDGRRLQARKDRVTEKLAPIVATMQDRDRAEVFEDLIGPDADDKFDQPGPRPPPRRDQGAGEGDGQPHAFRPRVPPPGRDGGVPLTVIRVETGAAAAFGPGETGPEMKRSSSGCCIRRHGDVSRAIRRDPLAPAHIRPVTTF